MKIAIIGHKRIPSNEGGIEKGVEQHAVRMVELGHEVHVFNRKNRHAFGEKIGVINKYKGIKIINIPTTNNSAEVPIYSFLATLRALFGGYDVISYRASGSCVMIPIAKLFKIRTVASLHGIDSQRDKWGGFASWYLKLGEKYAAQKADTCLVLSNNMKKYIENEYNRHAILFANGVEKPKHKNLEAMSKTFGLRKDNYILSLGRIAPEKGIHYLIEAFMKTKTKKKLVIAGGNASNSNYYEQLVELATSDDRIVFTGHISGEAISELYSNAYLFVLPSKLEGMANTLLEAMSYGNCCLVSNIPENTEVVHGYAQIFESANVEDLYDKLQFLVDNKLIVEQYKSVSSKYICSIYNWDKIVEQMLEIYAGNEIEYSEILNLKKEYR